MAEEEAGFTFVDKRRVVPDASSEGQAPASGLEAAQAQADAGADGNDAYSEDVGAALEEAGPAPTTYDLIGYCINLLASQAWQKLGLLADPQTGEAQPDLAEAKVAIDTVGDLTARLDSAPEAVVPADLRRDLRTLLNDLRLNYVSQRGPAAPL